MTSCNGNRRANASVLQEPNSVVDSQFHRNYYGNPLYIMFFERIMRMLREIATSLGRDCEYKVYNAILEMEQLTKCGNGLFS